MNIRNMLATLALVLIGNSAVAGISTDAVGQAGFSKLSEAEKAEVLKAVADKAAEKDAGLLAVATTAATATKEEAPKKVDAWLNVGERIGKMIGGAAKEVGVAVNDFVKTPVGMTAMALIVWHYMGAMVIHTFGAILVLTVGLGFIRYYAKQYTAVVIEYDTEKRDYFGRAVKKREERSQWDSGDVTGFMIATALVILCSIAVMFSY